MGWKLAKAAHEAPLAGNISDRARIALTTMCWTALDDPRNGDPAAEFWAGRQMIAAALLGINEAGTDTGNKAAQRAVRELIQAGLIERIRDGRGTTHARYRILIGGRWAPAEPVDNSPEWGP